MINPPPPSVVLSFLMVVKLGMSGILVLVLSLVSWMVTILGLVVVMR